MSATPLNQVQGEIDFGIKLKSQGVLGSAALTPSLLASAKVVDIHHLNVSLAHTHAEILKQTAKRRGIQLTGRGVSCSVCWRAKEQRACAPHRTTGRSKWPNGSSQYRNCKTFPCVTWTVVICYQVPGQCPTLTAAII